jgi:uncharacterized protein (TIGR02757 family)
VKLDKSKLRDLLDSKYLQYNRKEFIDTDPIQIAHKFTRREDIEIAGFLTAIIAWGQRKTIITNGKRLMQLMDNDPYAFILNAGGSDLKVISKFVHRTFNGDDCLFFIHSLQNIYTKHNGLKSVFENGFQKFNDIKLTIAYFRDIFFELPYLQRTSKHIADVNKNASAKRINMFLRWMVRKDDAGVDFGLWDKIPASALYVPLDVHTGTIARKLGLLTRTQNDWVAVDELTTVLREFDPNDPVKYDYALFGIGAFEDFKTQRRKAIRQSVQ